MPPSPDSKISASQRHYGQSDPRSAALTARQAHRERIERFRNPKTVLRQQMLVRQPTKHRRPPLQPMRNLRGILMILPNGDRLTCSWLLSTVSCKTSSL